MKLSVPYLKMRNGRPRWEPGPGLRAAGFSGQDLKDSLGQWLDEPAAIAKARELNAEVDAWRATGARKKHAPPSRIHPRCCQALATLFTGLEFAAGDFVEPEPGKEGRASPKWQKLKPSTRADYRNKLKIFLNSAIDTGGGDATFAGISVHALEAHHLYNWWEELVEQRGHHMANGIIAVVRLLFSYGRLKGWRKDNPAKELLLEVPAERLAIWLPQQAQVFLAVADELVDDMGRSLKSVGDAFLTGLHTGQRLSDVLAMPDSIFEADRIALTQMKRGALIDTKMTPQMAARVAEIRARRRDQAVPTIGGTLIVNEASGEPYNKNSFNKRFRLVREAAAKKLAAVTRDPRWQGPKIYEVAELRYQDLRDTYVTRSALAGNDAAHIAAVTGHSLDTITSIMKHYLAMTRAMADTATDRVVEWLKKEGITV
jgi:hypothetical protein